MTRAHYSALAILLLLGCAKPADAPKRDANPKIAALEDQIAKDTANWQLRVQLASELRRQNRFAEAESSASKAFMLEPDPGSNSSLEIAKIAAARDQPASAINLVKGFEKKRLAGSDVDPVQIAEVYAVLGDTLAVFRWLDSAVAKRSPRLQGIQSDPDLLGMQKDARWSQIIGKGK